MSRVIDHTQIAILYETITGQCQKRGVIGIVGNDTLDVDRFLARHPGLAAVIVLRASHPGPDQNEHFCRQAIADATGTPYFHRGADRAVMVHSSNTVVSVHYGNVPGLDFPDPDHSLISHLTADVGDPHHGGRTFSRDYAIINPQTGAVVQIVPATVNEPVASLPAPPIAGHLVREATGLSVGDVIRLK